MSNSLTNQWAIILTLYPIMLMGLIHQKKCIKMFKYFREKIPNNGILFLQKTHSSHDTVISWCEDFKGELFFFHMESQIHTVL